MTAARERIRINGLPLEADKFAKYFFEVWDLMGRNSEVRSIACMLECTGRLTLLSPT